MSASTSASASLSAAEHTTYQQGLARPDALRRRAQDRHSSPPSC